MTHTLRRSSAPRALSAKLKDQWHGTIVFVAQPAEETGNGARALLKDGLYERFGKPNFALGFHDKADLETGHIGVTEGYTSANVDSVDVTVRGVGGHGAYPHKTKDPIVLAAEIINAWQTIASRENNPLDPIVVTVGSIHGGTKHNIIPDEVKMQLTVRTYKSEMRERVLAAYRADRKRLRCRGWNPARSRSDCQRVQRSIYARDLQQSRTHEAACCCLEKVVRQRKRARLSIPRWAAKIFPNTACRTIPFRRLIFTSAQSIQRRSRSTSRREKNCQAYIRANSRPFPSQRFELGSSE